ncbi:unnamed protein product [Rotaria sp. Silwood1]|nr:unnamed protein product [Rotaria sp. Silwood1]
MNSTFQHIQSSISSKTIYIFWSHTQNETEARRSNAGNWTPNHFVPLLLPSSESQNQNSLTEPKAAGSGLKVFEALQWLRQNNALYRNVTINQLIISKLPEDDVPECLWATMEVSTNVEAAENERASYLPDPLTNASEFNNTTAIPIISRCQ